MAVATLGIISIGEMGLGIAKLLLAHNYKVITNATDRSQATQARAKNNDIELVSSDIELTNKADYILSIVPPRDALATAHRILNATRHNTFQTRARPRYFLDLNAISPRSARDLAALFAHSPDLLYIDGGIIGGPPALQADGTWARPSIPVSGPHRLADAQLAGAHLVDVLNVRHIDAAVGAATGLKMCFAALSKGFTALAIQAVTTARALGVGDELARHLDEYSPGVRTRVERGLVGMPAKAYRWAAEMEQIAETMEAEGGFTGDESAFRAVARIYEFVAGLELGQGSERPGDAEEVASALLDGMERRKLKKE